MFPWEWFFLTAFWFRLTGNWLYPKKLTSNRLHQQNTPVDILSKTQLKDMNLISGWIFRKGKILSKNSRKVFIWKKNFSSLTSVFLKPESKASNNIQKESIKHQRNYEEIARDLYGKYLFYVFSTMTMMLERQVVSFNLTFLGLYYTRWLG